MNALKPLLLCTVLLGSFNAYSDIYKCDINGVLTFSDKPCSDKYEKIEVSPQVVSRGKSKGAYQSGGLDSTSQYVEIRKLKRERSKVQSRINRLQKEMDSEIAALKNMTVKQANTLYGASRADAVATEMNAITEKYKTKISVETAKLSELSKQLQQLSKSGLQNFSAENENPELQRIGDYVANRAVEREVRSKQARIKLLQNQLDSELSKLTKLSKSAEPTIEGATYQKSLAKQKAAITKQYGIKIDTLRNQIALLQERQNPTNQQSEGM